MTYYAQAFYDTESGDFGYFKAPDVDPTARVQQSSEPVFIAFDEDVTLGDPAEDAPNLADTLFEVEQSKLFVVDQGSLDETARVQADPGGGLVLVENGDYS